MAALEHGTLTVWLPRTQPRGQPAWEMVNPWDTFFIPKFKQDFPDSNLHFEIMERQALDTALLSPQGQPLPDVALVEDFRDYAPLRESDAVISMWGMSRFDGGRWVIFRQSPHLEAARAFLLWLAHPPHYKPSWSVSTKSLIPTDQADVEALAQEAVRDYVNEDHDALSSIMDNQAARFMTPVHDGIGIFAVFNDVMVVPSIVEPILSFGNSKLAFVLVAASGEGLKDFGMIHSWIILRNEGAGWRVLHLSPGWSLPSSEEVMRSFDGLGFEDGIGDAAPEISLIGPPDHAEFPYRPGPEMEWAKIEPAPTTFILEFQQHFVYARDRDRWAVSDLLLVSPLSDGPTIRKRYSGGTGLCRWRVWAITKGGTVSLSEWRTVTLVP